MKWEAELNIYGKVRTFTGSSLSDCPFRYQGQYEDAETGLYYNRFRYYSPEEGMYISQDPIRLLGGDNLYGYVHDPNTWVDVFGLAGTGGAYIFAMSDGSIYVGKGDKERMNQSIVQHTAATNERESRTVVGQANISTNGNNELGKAVEYKAMVNEGATAREGSTPASIPNNLDNKIVTGKTAYNSLSKEDQELADRLAENLKKQMEENKENKENEQNNDYKE